MFFQARITLRGWGTILVCFTFVVPLLRRAWDTVFGVVEGVIGGAGGALI